MRIGFDTNVLVYAERLNDEARFLVARAIVDRLEPEEGVVASQSLGELYNVLTRKAGFDRHDAHAILLAWESVLEVAYPAEDTFFAAASLAADHDLQIWDAIILAVSEAAGCAILLSEDLQDGFRWRGIQVVNPFASKPNSLLTDFLGRS